MNKLFFVLLTLVVHVGCSKDAGSQSGTGKSLDTSPGAKIVKENCKVCHAQGINGAPVIGNKKMWAPRMEKGVPQLIVNASNGVGLMPAKGGNTDLTEEEISMAIEYMISQVK